MAEKELGTTSLGMKPNIAGFLCYVLTILTGIILYLLEKENKFVRFHALQSIFTFGGFLILHTVLGFIPVIGWSLIPLVGILEVILWVMLMIKAYQGELFKLPIVGDLAEKHA